MSRVEVVDVAERSRYEAQVDGERAGYLAYEAVGTHRVLTHTIVDPAHGGQGVGGTLVREALADVRSRGLSISSHCSFVDHVLATHPEHLDLVADPPR